MPKQTNPNRDGYAIDRPDTHNWQTLVLVVGVLGMVGAGGGVIQWLGPDAGRRQEADQTSSIHWEPELLRITILEPQNRGLGVDTRLREGLGGQPAFRLCPTLEVDHQQAAHCGLPVVGLQGTGKGHSVGDRTQVVQVLRAELSAKRPGVGAVQQMDGKNHAASP
jgi:hypothetical protein